MREEKMGNGMRNGEGIGGKKKWGFEQHDGIQVSPENYVTAMMAKQFSKTSSILSSLDCGGIK